jgi:Ca2+-binding RTX toxin-like protein
VDAAGDQIIDSAGTDTVRTSLSGYTLAAGIENLTIIAAVGIAAAAGITVTGNDLANTVTGEAGNDTIDGGIGNDSLVGAAGNDSLIGGAGADSITGGAGADTLTGGAGNDLFAYTAAVGESTTTSRDVITDFVRGQDRIALSGLDANTATIGDQAFTFRGALAFNGAAQLRMSFDAVNNRTLITANTDANTATIELEIALLGNFTAGANTLTAADFIL